MYKFKKVERFHATLAYLSPDFALKGMEVYREYKNNPEIVSAAAVFPICSFFEVVAMAGMLGQCSDEFAKKVLLELKKFE